MKKYLVPGLMLLISCCNGPKTDKDNLLARVNKDYLYKSDIEKIITPGISEHDSALLVRNYVNSWVTEKLVLNKALKNLRKADLQFEKQLDEYRNSLIIYKYESQLIAQSLDTVVTDNEIEKFYNDYIGNFQLKDNIVKVYYARFQNSLPELVKIRRFFYSDIPEHRDSLEKYIQQHSDLFYRDDETWILFEDVIRQIPINTYDQELFLKNHRKTEITDGEMVYLVNIKDFKIKEGQSPLNYEKENIRHIIINKRKLKIISEMRENVYNTALKENTFKIY